MTPNFRLFNFDPAEVGLFFAAEQIFRDYQEFLKNAILPTIAERYELRIREMLALVCIGSAVRPISSSDLAVVMRQDPATMTRSNVVLIGKGYIGTTKSFEDSRVKVLNITPKGQEVVDLYHQLVAETLETFNEHYLLQQSDFDPEQSVEEFVRPLQERAKTLAKLSSNMPKKND